MNKKEIKLYIFIAALAVAVCVIVQNFGVIQGVVKLALKALKPLFIGCIMAYIFNIIMNFFERHYFPKSTSGFICKSRRPVCLILSFAIAIALIVLILNIVVPEIVSAIKLISAEIPPMFRSSKDWAMKKMEEYPDIYNQLSNIELDTAAMASKLTDGAFGFFSSVISFIGVLTATVTNMLVGVIFAIYLLLRKDKLAVDIRRIMDLYLPEKTNRQVTHVCSVAHQTFTGFFIGQFIEAVIIGSLTFVGASLLRLPYAAMTGTIVGVTALIPIVGAFVGAGLSAFIICTENPKQALIFLIFLFILQQVETNAIYPKVVGSSIGLPGIWVLASVTVGGGLYNIMGMIIGVPLAATIYKIGFEYLDAKDGRKSADIPLEKTEKREKKVRKIKKK